MGTHGLPGSFFIVMMIVFDCDECDVILIVTMIVFFFRLFQNVLKKPPIPTLDKINITETEVLKLLNSLSVNKSCALDNLPPKILKLTAILIVSSLTKLFNKSLSQGIFPSKMERGKNSPYF